jgi:hypothetical protein
VAYDTDLAQRLRDRLADHPAVSQRQMFGGIAFLIGGNMAVGVTGSELIVRVGPNAHDAAVALPGARLFDLSGRPSPGWLVVGSEGFATEADFESWVRRGVDFAESLPPK